MCEGDLADKCRSAAVDALDSFSPQPTADSRILDTLRFVRAFATLYTFSKNLCSGSTRAVKLGIAVLTHCSAQTNCCKCAPFVGNCIFWMPSMRRGSNRTPALDSNLPHQRMEVAKKQHFSGCSFRFRSLNMINSFSIDLNSPSIVLSCSRMSSSQ